jgi:hypothetical protein
MCEYYCECEDRKLNVPLVEQVRVTLDATVVESLEKIDDLIIDIKQRAMDTKLLLRQKPANIKDAIKMLDSIELICKRQG